MSESDITLDLARAERIGLEEAIFCAHTTTAQLAAILHALAGAERRALLTRLSAARRDELPHALRMRLDYDAVSETAFFDWQEAAIEIDRVAIVTAGSSDMPVAREALRTLCYAGVGARLIADVGVAGLWRLQARLDEIRACPVCIAVAGMDAALPSVLGGLYAGALIAVPTSVGYGVARGGTTALHAILASCAPGIVAVNIDNGYGAACAALRILGS
jgi:NCAIR mutase (PurE)-related protein